MEACILSRPSCHLSPHASGQLIHERQELVGGDLLHAFLEEKLRAFNNFSKQILSTGINKEE